MVSTSWTEPKLSSYQAGHLPAPLRQPNSAPLMTWFGLLAWFVLRFTKFGRHTYVVGSNDEAGAKLA